MFAVKFDLPAFSIFPAQSWGAKFEVGMEGVAPSMMPVGKLENFTKFDNREEAQTVLETSINHPINATNLRIERIEA